MLKRPHPEVRSEAEPRRTHNASAILFAAGLLAAAPAHAHPHSPSGDTSRDNRDHFIQLGEAVHGGFGPLIALGIRLGDDVLKTLGVGPRTVDVTYYSGKAAPCPCAVDGIMLVTTASPGQGTLRVSDEAAAEGQYGRVVFRHIRSGRAVEYIIPDSVAALVKSAVGGDPGKRWSVMMEAPEAALFTRRFIKASN
jgi:FmdE, Molybdenum formylmethanofuran dehydrogenase operon